MNIHAQIKVHVSKRRISYGKDDFVFVQKYPVLFFKLYDFWFFGDVLYSVEYLIVNIYFVNKV